MHDRHPENAIKIIATMLAICLAAVISACSSNPKNPQAADFYWVYSVEQSSGSVLARHAPIIRIENGLRDYNKIGGVTAYADEKGHEHVTIDTTRPTLYAEQTTFGGLHGDYTNLLYRLHFSRVPFRVWPFSLTYGRNVGLFVIVTLNKHEQVVLVTTVHSCGCYLAFIPTDHLADSAYPRNWPETQQTIFGETLPGTLKLNGNNSRLIIDLRDASHRVHHVSTTTERKLSYGRFHTPMRLASVHELRALALGDKTISMFENEGARKGYVKGSHKPFEALLMSWWALDPFIGVDKDYGNPEKTGTIFYTSLKPWKRKASNMWPFADFLAFWGWSL